MGDAVRQAGAGRIYHERVQVPQFGQGAGAVVADDVDPGIVVVGVAAQVAYARCGAFHADYLAGDLFHGQGEGSHAAVQVGHAGAFVQAEPFDGGAHQGFRLRGVHLEEAGGAYHIADAAQVFFPKALAVQPFDLLDLAFLAGVGDDMDDAGGLERAGKHLDRSLAGEVPRLGPQRDLRALRTHAGAHADAEQAQIEAAVRGSCSLEEAQRARQLLRGGLDALVRKRAALGRDEPMAPFLHEAQRQAPGLVGAARQLELVAVSHLALAAHAGLHDLAGVFAAPAADPAERGDGVLPLRF